MCIVYIYIYTYIYIYREREREREREGDLFDLFVILQLQQSRGHISNNVTYNAIRNNISTNNEIHLASQ